MLRFECPACKAVMNAPASGVGRKCTCPKCGQRLRIPPPPKGTVLATPLPSRQGPAWKQQPPPERDGSQPVVPLVGDNPAMVAVPCPGCGRAIWLPPNELSLTIECSKCATRFVPVPVPSPPPVSQRPPSPQRDDVDEPVSLGYSPAVRPRGHAHRFGCLAGWLVCVGVCLTLYFWLVYDTTVGVYPPPNDYVQRVHNVGLMQNRMVGVLVGLGCTGVGLTLGVLGRKRG
jgi:hypothetical protein